MNKSTKFEKTIFISAYRNVSIRYILNSDLFKTLVKNEKVKIIVFVKKEHLNYCKKFYQYNNVEFEDIFFQELFTKLRSYIGTFFNIYRLLTCPNNKLQKNETIDIFSTTYKNEWVNKKRRLLVFLGIKLLSFFGNNSKMFRSFMIHLESLFADGSIYKFIFNKHKPNLLIVSSVGHMIDVYIMNQAKKNGVKILTIFHNWDGPTTKGYKSAKIDYAISWNNIMKEEIVNYQEISTKNIFLGGAVNYEKYFKMKIENDFIQTSKKLNGVNKRIIYAPGGMSLWPNNFDPLYHILHNSINGTYHEKLDIILRLHPNFISNNSNQGNGRFKNNVNKIIEELRELYPNNFSLSIPKVKYFDSDYLFLNEDLVDLGKLLSSADILITQYSTLLLEAAIFDLPAINIAYGNYRNNLKPANYYEKSTHIKTIMQFESYYNSYSADDLDRYINLFLKDHSIKFSNRLRLCKEMFPIRENIGKNIAHYIKELVF